MKRAEAIIKLVTPCIMSGSDQKKAQLRASSIRGHLRWWFRFLGGSSQEEQRIFGGIGTKGENDDGAIASNVVVRIDAKDLNVRENRTAEDIISNKYDYFLWPMSRPASSRGVVTAGQDFRLLLSHRGIEGGKMLDKDVLMAFLLFGSMGTRHRRAYGSIYPVKVMIDDDEYQVPRDEGELVKAAERLLPGVKIRITKLNNGDGDWKTAVNTCSEFLKIFRAGKGGHGISQPSEWGKHDHDLPFQGGNNIYRPILGLPYSQIYRNARSNNFSLEGKGFKRWESPVIFKVIELSGKFLPLAIILPDRAPLPGSLLRVKKNNNMPRELKLEADLLAAIMDPPPEYWSKAKIIFSTI